MSHWLDIVVATPAHSSVAGPLTYASESPLAPGQLVRVPLGRREVLGVVWAERDGADHLGAGQAKSVAAVLDGVDPLSGGWRELIGFTASYYQRSLGEVALAALPPQLRELGALQLARRLKRAVQAGEEPTARPALPELSAQQQTALQAFAEADKPALLFGATGSGKTEVYMRAAEEVLQADEQAQVLVMVPELATTLKA
jgi:primosomal protein N' (replication factor Y)